MANARAFIIHNQHSYCRLRPQFTDIMFRDFWVTKAQISQILFLFFPYLSLRLLKPQPYSPVYSPTCPVSVSSVAHLHLSDCGSVQTIREPKKFHPRLRLRQQRPPERRIKIKWRNEENEGERQKKGHQGVKQRKPAEKVTAGQL